MEKFSKLAPRDFKPREKKDKVLFSNDFVKLIDYEEYTTVVQSDCVFCVPVLIEKNQVLVRQEYIPPYKYATGQEYHLSFIGGGIEKGETPEEALLRELQEEAGLVLRDGFKIEFERPLFLSKVSSSRCHFSILFLTENDYHEVRPTTDGSKLEQISQTVKIDLSRIDSLIASDLLTEFLILKLRDAMNL
jgi:8-oxo-dGTP pyrophosphatase MutT (NUDIX family)